MKRRMLDVTAGLEVGQPVALITKIAPLVPGFERIGGRRTEVTLFTLNPDNKRMGACPQEFGQCGCVGIVTGFAGRGLYGVVSVGFPEGCLILVMAGKTERHGFLVQ